MARSCIDISATFKLDYKINDLLWKSILQDTVPGRQQSCSPQIIWMWVPIGNGTQDSDGEIASQRMWMKNWSRKDKFWCTLAKAFHKFVRGIIRSLANSEFNFVLEAQIEALHLQKAMCLLPNYTAQSSKYLRASQRRKSILMNL